VSVLTKPLNRKQRKSSNKNRRCCWVLKCPL